MTQQIQQFAKTAEQFCVWAEASPSAPESETRVALEYLSSLYQQALKLPNVFGEEEPVDVTYDAWLQIFQRFGSFPFNLYAQCFEPSKLEAERPVIADLADDLADIWRDLKRGLSLFNAGYISAANREWRQSFWQHWGRHASSGIYALHSWPADHS